MFTVDLTDDGTLVMEASRSDKMNAAHCIGNVTHHPTTLDEHKEHIRIMESDTVTYRRKPKKGNWHELEIWVQNQYVDPYLDLLEKRTGYQLINLIGTNRPHKNGLKLPSLIGIWYTHIVADAILYDDGSIWCLVYQRTYTNTTPKQSAEHAHKAATRYVTESLGTTELIPEYKQNRNGTYSPNPDYATGKQGKIHPSTQNEKLWTDLWKAWRRHGATTEQKRVLNNLVSDYDRSDKDLHHDLQTISHGPLYINDPNGSIDFDGKGKMVRIMPWDKFAQLGEVTT